MTIREQAISAVVERLAAVGQFTVARNEVVPAQVGSGGHVVVRDGERVEVERTLGIPHYYVTHRIGIEALAGGGDPDGGLDALIEDISAALGADPTLGGVVLFSELDLDDIETAGDEGAAAVKSALLALMIEYACDRALD